MIRPVLFIARATEPILLEVGSGYLDDDEAYEMQAVSTKIAPAGSAGECMFTLLYLTTKHYDADVSVWVTPIVDGVALPTQRLDLTGVIDSQGEHQTHEISLTLSYTVASVEKLRYAPRGTWFEVQIETKYGDGESGAAATADKLIVESVEVEYEVLRETRQATGVAT